MSYSDGDAVYASIFYKIQTMFSGTVQQIGWVFYFVGLLFSSLFLSLSDLSFVHYWGSVTTTEGRSIGAEETNASSGDVPVMATHFTFTTPEGTTFDSVSYATGDYYEAGVTVPVEYPKGKPEYARIVAMRRGHFGAGVLFVLIFPFVGFMILIFGLNKGVKSMMLLSGGRLAHGRLVGKKPTSVYVNNQQVMALTFQYQVDGQHYSTVAKTHTPEDLQDEKEEALIYKPSDPSFSVMVDALPGRPTIDERGHIRPKNMLGFVPVIILPGLSLLVHLAMIF